MSESAATPGQQSRALWHRTIACTICFALWTVSSIIGKQTKKDLKGQRGLLIGAPIRTRPAFRMALGA